MSLARHLARAAVCLWRRAGATMRRALSRRPRVAARADTELEPAAKAGGRVRRGARRRVERTCAWLRYAVPTTPSTIADAAQTRAKSRLTTYERAARPSGSSRPAPIFATRSSRARLEGRQRAGDAA